MNRKVMIISIAIGVIGFTAYGFMDKMESVEPTIKDISAEVSNDTTETKDFSNLNLQITKENIVYYDVRRKGNKNTTKEILLEASTLSDFINDYPSNWISNYLSVEVSSTQFNEKISATSKDNVLNNDQKVMLKNADYGSDLDIKVIYEKPNPMTGIPEPQEMNISMVILPAIEAQFADGETALVDYFKSKTESEILKLSMDTKPLNVHFTINESGEVENVRLNQSIGVDSIDEIVMDLIEKMPNWTPAKSADGQVVKQQFEFTIALGMDGC
jgi:TonB family protein